MIKTSYASEIIDNKLCICKSKLKQKINFGNLPLINNYQRKINLRRYPVIITQCKKCLLIQPFLKQFQFKTLTLNPNCYQIWSLEHPANVPKKPLLALSF